MTSSQRDEANLDSPSTSRVQVEVQDGSSQRDEVLEGRLAYYLIEYADGRNSLTKTIRSLEALILLDRSQREIEARIDELQAIETPTFTVTTKAKSVEDRVATLTAQLEALKDKERK